MGYCMNQREADFAILNENKGKALELLKKYASENKGLSWVDSNTVMGAETLSEAFDECRYDIEEDENGNVSEIYFSGEKLGNDEQIFKAIAPVVENGSFIEMSGEDGFIWRWVFENGECEEKQAKISWE